MTKYTMLYITAANKDEARKIGDGLLAESLAACVNIIDGMESMYWWEGEIQKANEAVLIAKTTEANVEKATALVKQLHSYDCPCVVAIPITGGNPEFLKWIDDNTA